MENPRAILAEIRKDKKRLSRAERAIKLGLRLMQGERKTVAKPSPKPKPKQRRRSSKKHSAPAPSAT